MGKRRMTQVSQGVPAPTQVFEGVWNFGKVLNRDQWLWEPPSSRHIPARAPPPPPPLPPTPDLAFVPDLLHELPRTLLEFRAESHDSEIHNPISAEMAGTFSSCLSNFQLEIRGAPWHTVDELCSKFALKVKEFITLGVASKADLDRSVDIFDAEILRVAGSRTHSDRQCLSLYWAIWEGLQARSKTNSELTGVQALEILGRRIAHIENLPEAQNLALKIIRTVPNDRLSEIKETVSFLVQYWSKRFRKSRHYKLESLEYSLREYPTDGFKYSFNPRRSPLILAVLSMAKFLDELPLQLAHCVIRKNTEVIMRGLTQGSLGRTLMSLSASRRRRYIWMLIVANARCTSEGLLVESWKILGRFSKCMDGTVHHSSNLPPLTSRESCSVILNFLTSHNKTSRRKQIGQVLMNKLRNESISQDAAVILATLGENFSGTAAISFLRILVQIGAPGVLRNTVQSLRRDGTKLRESRLVSMIRDIPHTQPRDAFEIFKAHHHLSSGLFSPLKLEQFPALVVRMINHPKTDPNEIWGHVQKGLWTRFGRHPCQLPKSSKRLSPQKIALVYKMAEAFAGARHLSDGVAFRNVVRCARYLRRHRVPLTSRMSKALTNVGIVRALHARRWPGTTKSRWILGVIEKEEGEKVADVVDNVLTHWRRNARFIR